MENATETSLAAATITRFKRRYKVSFTRNPALSDTFKSLETRVYDKTDARWGWVVSKEGLFDVMMAWKEGGRVAWNFQPAELRAEFVLDARLVRDARRAAEAQLTDRVVSNAAAVVYKDQLRADPDFKLAALSGLVRPDTPITFYYHQHITAAWLIHRGGGILAAEMGLGKTFVFCAAALALCPPGRKVLIVAPKSLVLGIRDDLVKLMAHPWHVLGYGRKQPHTAAKATFILAAYSFFGRPSFQGEIDLADFGPDGPGAVVLDESHLVKNHETKAYKRLNAAFGGRGLPIICSTGTPIKSWGREVWTQLHLVDPVSFPSRSHFEKTYCGAFLDPRWRRIAYDPQLERRTELNALLQPYMFRVRKEDVINLPPKIYRKLVIPLTPAERLAYQRARDTIREQIEADGTEAGAMVLLGKLRQYCAAAKVGYVQELVDRHNAEGEKVVIVDQFRATVAEFAAHYGNRAVVRTGGQDMDAQLAAVKLFQRDPLPGVPDGVDNFIGTTDTCKYGLTLTAARVLYLVTLAWTPAECDQVFDRTHRISQTRPVLIFLPVLEGTVDEYVYEKLEIKRAQVLHVIDNQEYAGDMKTSMFADVMRYLRDEK